MAKNKRGLAQNYVENDGYLAQLDITANVFEFDNEGDYPRWIEMERAIPFKRKQKPLEKLLGITMEELHAFLALNNPNQRNTNMYRNMISQERIDELWEDDIANQLAQMVGNIDMEPADIAKSNSWGLVKRDGKAVPVLIDFGFTKDVAADYYAR